MASKRTEYRQRREQMLQECIALLVQMLTLNKQDLEKVRLPFFKKLKQSIEKRSFD